MSSPDHNDRANSFDTDILDESTTDVKADLGDFDDMDEDMSRAEDHEEDPRERLDSDVTLARDRLESEGFDSGYDTDPVDRFFEVARWQRRLTLIQRRLSRSRTTSFGGDGTNSDSAGTAGTHEDGPNEFSEMINRARDTFKVQSKKMAKAVDDTAYNLKQRTNQVVKDVDRKLKESRSEVIKVVDRASGTLRKRGETLQARRNRMAGNLVGNLQQQRAHMRQNYKKQMDDLRMQLDQMLARTRSAKARQMRHMVCFCCAMMDVVVTAYWLGAFPHTHHYYYTFKFILLVSLRAVWYRLQGQHYYLYDMCYYCNLALNIQLWLFPTSEWLFVGCHGFSGTLLISVFLFRNSFVPHSLDRITSTSIHLMPVVQMWASIWYCEPARCIPADKYSPIPSLCLYLVWMVGYYTNQFIINRKRIERKGYETLYKHMAINMGLLKLLPKSWRSPVRSRIVFMCGHFVLFAFGLPFLYMNFALHTLAIVLAVFWAFKNGASFYITYFWKVYNDQITAFEKQIASAEADAARARQEDERAQREHDREDDREENKEMIAA